ncbi:MAG: ABC transporter ATP-binding protein [Chloroflexi bacterium]|nr:ABC transporter ATP-binding protein [Chloroflexota bacterium]
MRILIRLLGFLHPFRGLLLVTLGMMIGASVFSLAVPQIIGYALDSAIASQRAGDRVTWRPLLVGFGLIMTAATLRGVFAFSQQYLGEKLSQSVAYTIRNAIYDRLQKLSFAYHDQAQIGQIMSRATQDVEAVRMYINMGIIRVGAILILLIVTLILMLRTSPALTLVSWTFLPVMALISIWASNRLRPLWELVQDGQGRMSNVLQENLSGVRVVKAFSREDFEARKFNAEVEQLFNYSYRTNQMQAQSGPLLTALGALAIVSTVLFGGREVADGTITPGELVAFVVYLQLLQQPVRMLGFMINIFSRTASAGQRIYDILDAESAVQERAGALVLTPAQQRARGEVRFEQVAFGYGAQTPVLHDVTFEAHPGEIVALVGPTGSGKSSLVNLMPRFYDVTAGHVLIGGHDVRDLTIASLRGQIGIVQQDVFLFIDTIRENIRYGRLEATNEEVEEAAKAARIHEFILSLPDGYDTWVGERGVTLSGGQKQRISIARTLLLDPAILIFDDSTSSVDMETEYLIQQALAELMQGRTTFVIAQRLRTVKAADTILVLDRGAIVERGKHEDLARGGGLYQRIYELELRDQEEAFEASSGAAATRA